MTDSQLFGSATSSAVPTFLLVPSSFTLGTVGDPSPLRPAPWRHAESPRTGTVVESWFRARQSPASSVPQPDAVDEFLIGPALRSELATARRLVEAARGCSDGAWRSYISSLDDLTKAVLRTSDFPRDGFLNALVVSRNSLLSELRSFNEWARAAAAVFPEAENLAIPSRFIRTDETTSDRTESFLAFFLDEPLDLFAEG